MLYIMKLSRVIPLISFVLMLFIVGFNMTKDEYIVVENRFKTEFPSLTMSSIFDRSYQDGIESYFGDQIIAEKKLVEAKSQYEILMGIDTIRNSVMIGDDMFFSKTCLNDIRGKLLSDLELEETLEYLIAINKYYEDAGYDFYLAVGPNKASLYGERLPFFNVASYRTMNQLQDNLLKDNIINYIDLYKVLEEAKAESEEALYFSYDSHWNYLGGLIAAEEVLNTIYPKHNINIEAYRNNLVYERASNTDLANIIGVGDLYYDITYKPALEVNYYKDFIDLGNESEEELIVIRDSFFDMLAPVFEELDVSRKYVAFLSHYKEGYEPSKTKGKVIMLVVERNIYPSIKGAYETIFNE